MTKEQQKIYTQTARRLARMGIKDPTAQIVALAEEIERYRDKIRRLEERQTETPPAPPIMPFPKTRYTYYDPNLGRFVIPLPYQMDGDGVTFYIKTGGTYTARSNAGEIYTGKDPDIVFGEVIDKLARYENQEEEQNHAT